MITVFGIPAQALFGQLLIGLINGSFYALLSLGLAVIFGLLNIINFTHGAQYMMGAFLAYFLLQYAGLGYWWALLIVPVLMASLGVVLERFPHAPALFATAGFMVIFVGPYVGPGYRPVFSGACYVTALLGVVLTRRALERLSHLDHLYGLLLTFGLALIIQGLFRNEFGSSGLPYRIPEALTGGQNLGFMVLPNYRAWVIVFSLTVCLGTWWVIERTRLGAYLRAATENPTLVRAFGINVPLMITLTYGFGVGLAALASVLAAPIYEVNPLMGGDLIIVVFAVVVIGGMGSIMGSIVTGFGLGVIEGLTKVFYPEASNTVIFVIMALVLLAKPAGLFGRVQ